MIPTVEDIIVGLARGDYTVEQARRWIARHLKMAEERGARNAGVPEPVGINGLTEAETSATASVFGLPQPPKP